MSSTPADFPIKTMPPSWHVANGAITMAGLRMLPLHKEICLCDITEVLGLTDRDSPRKHAFKLDHNGLAHALISGKVDDYISSLPRFMVQPIKAAELTKTGPLPACGHARCRPNNFVAPGVGMCNFTVTDHINRRLRGLTMSWACQEPEPVKSKDRVMGLAMLWACLEQDSIKSKGRPKEMAVPSACLEQDTIKFKDPVRYRFFTVAGQDPGIGSGHRDQDHLSSADFLTARSRKGTRNRVEHTIHLDKMVRYLEMHFKLPPSKPNAGQPAEPDALVGLETVPVGFFRAIAILAHARDRILSRFPADVLAENAELEFVDESRSTHIKNIPRSLDESESETDGLSYAHLMRIRLMKHRKQTGNRWTFEEMIKALKVAADITALIELYVAVVEIWSGKKLTEVPNVCALETDNNAGALTMILVRPEWVEKAMVSIDTVGGKPEDLESSS